MRTHPKGVILSNRSPVGFVALLFTALNVFFDAFAFAQSPPSQPRSESGPWMVYSYAEVLERSHVVPLTSRLAACLRRDEPRELDLEFRVTEVFRGGNRTFRLDRLAVNRPAPHEIGALRAEDFWSLGTSIPLYVSPETSACLTHVIQSRPLPPPWGMDSRDNHLWHVMFHAPPSRATASAQEVPPATHLAARGTTGPTVHMPTTYASVLDERVVQPRRAAIERCLGVHDTLTFNIVLTTYRANSGFRPASGAYTLNAVDVTVSRDTDEFSIPSIAPTLSEASVACVQRAFASARLPSPRYTDADSAASYVAIVSFTATPPHRS